MGRDYHRRPREAEATAHDRHADRPEPAARPSGQSPEPRSDGPAPGIEYAPHGGRLVAYIIDSIIVTIVAGFFIVIGVGRPGSGTTIVGNRADVGRSGATVGSLRLRAHRNHRRRPLLPVLLGARRPDARACARSACGSSATATASRIGWGTALLRLIGLWVAGAVFYIGYIWIFVDKRRRGWQDLIAGTVVIKQP